MTDIDFSTRIVWPLREPFSDNDARYRIKTPHGYAYTTGNGRYGRFDGDKFCAEVLCARHAEPAMISLLSLDAQFIDEGDSPAFLPELELYPGHMACARCKREEG